MDANKLNELIKTNERLVDQFSKLRSISLIKLCENNELEQIQELFKNCNFDLNFQNGEILTTAAKKGFVNIVKFLIENGADPSLNNQAAIRLASLYGKKDVVKYLLCYQGSFSILNYIKELLYLFYMKAKQVLQILDISRISLYNYVKAGKISVTLLPNGYYDYNESDVFSLKSIDNRKNVIYARVSTHKQSKDLERQVSNITIFCKKNNISINETITDISSGVDLDRPNFSNLLNDVLHYKISTIYISHKDRLTRLSYKTLQSIFDKFGTKIVVINDREDLTDDQEYYEDLISLMHYFSTKMYSHRRQKLLKE